MPETVAIIPQQRSIGGIVAQVTVREAMRDDYVITDHPVQDGSIISDHAYRRPAEIEIEVGWDGTQALPSDVYSTLRKLQEERQPFTISTDRRQYDSMLITSIATVTDQRTAYSFLAIVRCRQIITVSTQLVMVPGKQAHPEATAGSMNGGTKALIPGPTNPTGYAGVQGLAGSSSGTTVSPPSGPPR